MEAVVKHEPQLVDLYLCIKHFLLHLDFIYYYSEML